MDCTVSEKEFLARRGRKSLIPVQTGAREGGMRARNTHQIKTFQSGANIQKIQVASK